MMSPSSMEDLCGLRSSSSSSSFSGRVRLGRSIGSSSSSSSTLCSGRALSGSGGDDDLMMAELGASTLLRARSGSIMDCRRGAKLCLRFPGVMAARRWSMVL